jgi:hypothetical protein
MSHGECKCHFCTLAEMVEYLNAMREQFDDIDVVIGNACLAASGAVDTVRDLLSVRLEKEKAKQGQRLS